MIQPENADHTVTRTCRRCVAVQDNVDTGIRPKSCRMYGGSKLTRHPQEMYGPECSTGKKLTQRTPAHFASSRNCRWWAKGRHSERAYMTRPLTLTTPASVALPELRPRGLFSAHPQSPGVHRVNRELGGEPETAGLRMHGRNAAAGDTSTEPGKRSSGCRNRWLDARGFWQETAATTSSLCNSFIEIVDNIDLAQFSHKLFAIQVREGLVENRTSQDASEYFANASQSIEILSLEDYRCSTSLAQIVRDPSQRRSCGEQDESGRVRIFCQRVAVNASEINRNSEPRRLSI
ncbi:hypothetical protein K438DRAFT_319161 [Mycena galopus ATCC 62051]|nr:hypothetical protein K438DRAFT_319161 [Mycena galopus ATCC 62051]